MSFAEEQRALARARVDAPWKPKPVGACDQCGAWREDGKPPTTHFTGCWHGEYPHVRLRSMSIRSHR
jgi:hypothetical protein